jgi:hypothetical protein
MYANNDFSILLLVLAQIYFIFLITLPLFYISGLNTLFKIKPFSKVTKNIFLVTILVLGFVIPFEHDELGLVRLFFIVFSFIYAGAIFFHDIASRKIAKMDSVEKISG